MGSNDCPYCGGTGEVEVDECDRRGEHITVTALCECAEAVEDEDRDERRADSDEEGGESRWESPL